MEMKQYLEHRLNDWVHWYYRNADGSQGYSNKSISATIIENHGQQQRRYYSKSLSHDEAAEEIEKCVTLLAKQNSILAKALRTKYFECGSLRDKAKRLGVSHSQYKIYTEMAMQWLNGILSAKQFYNVAH